MAESVKLGLPKGHVLKRPALSRLIAWMAMGDTLICSGRDCFGTKPERLDANLEYIRDGGIEVQFVQKAYFNGSMDYHPETKPLEQ